ncbi:metallophosphoesterase [Burkholderia cepacia]|uniref:metallophosphoesterase n=1 Tax=Burkholderia cepacia TaxID=292 RepID=UPI001C973182|nr:metallophosphoesterase [Burkholderia cepacia]MBY4803055.1 metallophosphoesterase [Burkholderia cepacia]MCA8333733.1 metallophosphoesterase [Burkholderia cepacia]
MRILHLSDIHFRAPECLDPDHDRDKPYRTRLERHLTGRVAAMGSIDAIMVGGDIAYQGDPREYEVARAWLLDLAAKCGCDSASIWVVPGNHDVNRKSCEDAPTMNAQAMIFQAQSEDDRLWMLRKQLNHNVTGQALFHGHAAYNEFAAKMSCQVYPGHLYWKQERELGPGVTLRIHGLTSTLLSGRNGANDLRGSLYLSPLQTIDPSPNVVNLTICHHPPDWLIDGDDVEDMLNERVMFQVFGHKHRQRIDETMTYVRWSAGSVNPSHAEKQFEPSYNIIELNVAGEGAERRIDVASHLYRYQPRPEGFQPIRKNDGQEVFRHWIPFPAEEASGERTGGIVKAVTPEAFKAQSTASASCTDAEASMGDAKTRHLVDRFWDLDSSDRREIALELDLISDSEIDLPEPHRYGVALIRASERGLLDRLEQLVDARER